MFEKSLRGNRTSLGVIFGSYVEKLKAEGVWGAKPPRDSRRVWGAQASQLSERVEKTLSQPPLDHLPSLPTGTGVAVQ